MLSKSARKPPATTSDIPIPPRSSGHIGSLEAVGGSGTRRSNDGRHQPLQTQDPATGSLLRLSFLGSPERQEAVDHGPQPDKRLLERALVSNGHGQSHQTDGGFSAVQIRSLPRHQERLPAPGYPSGFSRTAFDSLTGRKGLSAKRALVWTSGDSTVMDKSERRAGNRV